MGEGVARALDGRGVEHLIMVNRTAERVETLVAGLPVSAADTLESRDLDDLVVLLGEVDVAFATVASAHPIVTRSDLEAALTLRTGRPDLVVVDLGVPRNVEPEAASLDGLVLLNMDDLRAAVADAITGRQDEVAAANSIVSDEVERYRAASRARDAAPMVSVLRARVEEARMAELDRQRSKRTDLDDVQWEQVDAVTRAMVAKLLHQPTVVLKEAAGTPRGERLVESLRALFDL